MTHWVFGYGSLIFRPGFEFRHSEPARLDGFHRSPCVLSHKYRGTLERLGLVFGLADGGHCHGMAFEVDDAVWPHTLAYLREREQVTSVYIEKQLPVMLALQNTSVIALTYVADANHPQYAGALSEAEILAHIRQGHGEAGSCADYVRHTAKHLRDMGFADPALEALVAQI